MSKPPSILLLVAILAVLTIFGVVGARYQLNKHSASTMEQLALVRSDIAAMPEPDRAFLVELALTCNVVERQPVRAEVVACLRSVPTNASATERLDRLLAQGQ